MLCLILLDIHNALTLRSDHFSHISSLLLHLQGKRCDLPFMDFEISPTGMWRSNRVSICFTKSARNAFQLCYVFYWNNVWKSCTIWWKFLQNSDQRATYYFFCFNWNKNKRKHIKKWFCLTFLERFSLRSYLPSFLWIKMDSPWYCSYTLPWLDGRGIVCPFLSSLLLMCRWSSCKEKSVLSSLCGLLI